MNTAKIFDTAIIGCGIAGMATAMRLQNKGKSTIIFEAHGQPGGCAGYFRKKGFSFDVGATTLVDFDDNGVGGEFFKSVNLMMPESDLLDYTLWLPDRKVQLYNDKQKWAQERLDKFGNTTNHIAFWKFMDNLADVFWNASRKGIKLPLQNITDILKAINAIGLANIHLAWYLNNTMEDALIKFKLQNDTALRGAISMLLEDTVHAQLNKAPLINSALGITIRGAGLRRAKGGMKGLWEHLVIHYKEQAGTLKLAHRVLNVTKESNIYKISTSKGDYYALQLVSAVPIQLTQKLVPFHINKKIEKYIARDNECQGGAVVVFLGVPNDEVAHQHITHHQLMYDYNAPLGNGNNMFISVSTEGDTKSAPEGYRAVMLSTHCNLQEWQGLSEDAYELKKEEITRKLISIARKVYPNLGENAVVFETGTPKTYHKYTSRINGAVGGVRQERRNSNLNAIPHDIGVNNFRLAGDSTWPGLGTVACILGSRIVADQLSK